MVRLLPVLGLHMDERYSGVIRLLATIRKDDEISAIALNAEGVPDSSNPQGARRLVYKKLNDDDVGTCVTLTIDAGNRLSNIRADDIDDGDRTRRSLTFDFAPALPERPATPTRQHRPAWADSYATTNATQPGFRRRRSSSAPPSGAPSPQRARGESDLPSGPVQSVQQQLRQDALASVTTTSASQDMAEMRHFHQSGIQHIERHRFYQPFFTPVTYHDGLTVDEAHRDVGGNPRFYLERQDFHSCAQHAVNAMVGGPILSLAAFARHEHDHQPAGTPARGLEDIRETMVHTGVHAETVSAVLQETGIPVASYRHTPIVNVADMPEMNWEHLQQIDALATDRLVMHVSTAAQDAETGGIKPLSSHFVAFRRTADTGQWMLLDSLRDSPQAMTPSQYLREEAAAVGLLNDVTVIVPRSRLRLSGGTADGEPLASGSGTAGSRHTEAAQPVRQAWETPQAEPSSGVQAPGMGRFDATGRPVQFKGLHYRHSALKGGIYLLTYIDFTKDPNGTTRYMTFEIKKYKSQAEAERAANESAEKLRNGTFIPPASQAKAEYQSGRKGVNWKKGSRSNGGYWEVSVGDIRGVRYSKDYNGSIEAAKLAAIQLADEIECNPGKFAGRSAEMLNTAERQSIVAGVKW